jgi:hypothetical protein
LPPVAIDPALAPIDAPASAIAPFDALASAIAPIDTSAQIAAALPTTWLLAVAAASILGLIRLCRFSFSLCAQSHTPVQASLSTPSTVPQRIR